MRTVNYELEVFPKLYEMVVNTSTYQPDKSEFQICRFCNEKDPSKFKSKAHIIPEFTGNKKLIHYCECDTCNNKFSKYERDLFNFGGIKNIIVGIKGKKKYPKHIDYKNNFSIQSSEDGLIINEHKPNDVIKVKNGKLASISSETVKFSPRNVQKALVKIALSMMDKNELYKFSKTMEWLSNPEDSLTEEKHPCFILIERENKIGLKKPAAMLMKRKRDYNSPEYSMLFYYSLFAIQIFIPFNEADKNLDYNDIKLPLSTLVVCDLKNFKEVKFEHYYMTKLKKVKMLDKWTGKI